ncbi:MAG: leucyl aminopeptidase [Cyanobacteria bacterium M5B4]|nr:MAG: leucyl aminopeptidase [Cyanobacteria bacterium M5B4]
MEIRAVSATPQTWSGDALVLSMYSGELSPQLQDLDRERLGGTLQELIAEQKFKGDVNTSVSGRVGTGSQIKKVMLIGLGEPAKANTDNWRKAAAQATKWANQAKVKTLALHFPLFNADAELTAQVVTEGVLLASHQDKRFKSKSEEEDKNEPTLETIELLESNAQAGIDRGRLVCEGVILARELVSAPANVVTPAKLAETAQEIAQAHPDRFALEILEREQCQALGMGAFLGVSQASDLPPKFIHLTYKQGENPVKVAIVGKGLTFDSGGLNLKTGGSGIEMMKIDMAGAAAALGCAHTIGALQPQNLEVHFIIAACENMISGRAMHPGDILTAANGKTIEVNNTDAEGRLTLADALVFADRLEPKAIVDLATLTGACIVALGEGIGGLWATDDELAQRLEQSAKAAGEKFWRMPLEEAYWEGMKSPIADCKNAGGRYGGAITAALFLKQFVEKTTAWAHLDVAGPVWTEKESGYNNSGGTGYPVRTLVNWVLSMAS